MCIGLEEESTSSLHDALTGLTIDAAKGGRVGIGNDIAIDRVVEDVERLDARFEVALFAFT
jgi:hypothetical protein